MARGGWCGSGGAGTILYSEVEVEDISGDVGRIITIQVIQVCVFDRVLKFAQSRVEALLLVLVAISGFLSGFRLSDR